MHVRLPLTPSPRHAPLRCAAFDNQAACDPKAFPTKQTPVKHTKLALAAANLPVLEKEIVEGKIMMQIPFKTLYLDIVHHLFANVCLEAIFNQLLLTHAPDKSAHHPSFHTKVHTIQSY